MDICEEIIGLLIIDEDDIICFVIVVVFLGFGKIVFVKIVGNMILS